MSGEVEKHAKEKSKTSTINSAIQTCHDVNQVMTDNQIKAHIMRKLGLSGETAGKYFTPQMA